MPRCCRYCQQPFQPSKSHPKQLVCSRHGCQRQRSADYRRAKLAADSAYAEKCRESARHWRKEHSSYWRQYRDSHPGAVERNREQQMARDRKQHLKILANNTLAPAQLWILEALPRHAPPSALLANNTALDSAPGLAP